MRAYNSDHGNSSQPGRLSVTKPDGRCCKLEFVLYAAACIDPVVEQSFART